MRAPLRLVGLLCALAPASLLVQAESFSSGPQGEVHEEANIHLRNAAGRRIVWQDARSTPEEHDRPEVVNILAINDFHGQLSASRRIGTRPVGGAAVLAAYLKAAQSERPDSTFIVHAGDHVGASPPESSLFQDEPSIAFLNSLANRHCAYADRMHPKCNIVGTPGNHEFDEGKDELLRLLNGGNHSTGPFLENPYRGARFPSISSNVVDEKSGKPILPPFVIKEVGAIRLAFIGAVLKETPTVVTPTGIAGLTFLGEAESINRYIQWLRQVEGIRAFIVLIHQGGRQTQYEGPTQPGGLITGQEIMKFVDGLDDDVDVVVSGHSHAFTNALVKNRNGKDILVTQAFASGTAYGDIGLRIDRRTGDVVEKWAAIVTTYADAGPGLAPDAQVRQLVSQVEVKVAPLVTRVIGEAAADISRTENAAGESALGNLIADAQRATLGTDFAFMNPGGIRTDLPKGSITYGDLFAIQPFSNSLVRMTLTGRQIYDLLNQQWSNQPHRILKISGLAYTWDNARPIGNRVVEVRKNGVLLDRSAVYSVTANDFLSAGGDNFTIFAQGRDQVGGPIDLKALISYLQALPQPFTALVEGRISRLN